MLKTIKDINVKDKKVLLRVDFNVPLTEAGQVDPAEDWRIRRTLPTINYLKSQQAKIILLAHFGRPGGKKDPSLSLRPIADYLSNLLDEPVIFFEDCCGALTQKAAADLKPAQVLFLENIRFYPGEESNNLEFNKQLASLGEVFINDAFSNSHRPHASIIGLARLMPAAAGLLLAEEIKALSKLAKNPPRPFSVLVGGVKVSSKLKFIKHFLQTADNVVLGGALANTVLVARGLAVGRSIIEEEMINELRALELTHPKLHLPVDVVVAVEPKTGVPSRITAVGNNRDNEMILDIGPDSQRLFSDIIEQSGSVVWTGPMGLREIKDFSLGTKAVAQAMAQTKAYTVVGGGDTVGFLFKEGLLDKISYISTGGSALLDFVADGQLPGLAALGYY